MAVASAIIGFNDGAVGMLKVFESLNIEPGVHTNDFCKGNDLSRLYVIERKCTPVTKNRRKQLRAQRKGFIDKAEEKEGVTYGAGLF